MGEKGFEEVKIAQTAVLTILSDVCRGTNPISKIRHFVYIISPTPRKFSASIFESPQGEM